jgi:hypothetical protein
MHRRLPTSQTVESVKNDSNEKEDHRHNMQIRALARGYFSDSAFLPADSFGDGWLQAGEVGVFAADGSMRRHWLAPGAGG